MHAVAVAGSALQGVDLLPGLWNSGKLGDLIGSRVLFRFVYVHCGIPFAADTPWDALANVSQRVFVREQAPVVQGSYVQRFLVLLSASYLTQRCKVNTISTPAR